MFDYGAEVGEGIRTGKPVADTPSDGAAFAVRYGVRAALGDARQAEQERKEWREKEAARQSYPRPEDPGVGWLPAGSWVVRFEFTLAKDLLTKDDRSHYPIENPLRKDPVFAVPLLAGASWKGCLRAAYREEFGTGQRKAEERIFGTRKGEIEDGTGEAGRLICFATEFDKIGFVVISPHERSKKIGKPILYEAAPRCAKGVFQAAYCNRDGKAGLSGAAEDLVQVCQVVALAMRVLGVGAKTSSGFGAVENEIAGTIQVYGVEGEPEKVEEMDKLAEVAQRVAGRIRG